MAAPPGLYGPEYNLPPIVDNPHPRGHQHEGIFDFLGRRGSRQPEAHPNRPDVDVRDTGVDFAVEVEVPGVKNVDDIAVRWLSNRTLVVSGTNRRPPLSDEDKDGEKAAAPPDIHGSHAHGPPYLLLGERKIGPFRRIFTFPTEVEMEKLAAWLEAGVLTLRVPKKGHLPLQNDGLVKVVSKDK